MSAVEAPPRRRSGWTTLALSAAVVGFLAGCYLLVQALAAGAEWVPAAFLTVMNVVVFIQAWHQR